MRKDFLCLTIVLVMLLVFAIGSSYGENIKAFPEKTINIIVPWSVGGGSDLMARVLAVLLSEHLGVNVVVLNKPGGTGVIGSLDIAGATPDGYTIGLLSQAIQTTQYTSEQPTDRNAYDYIIGTSLEPFTLTVRADSPWKTLDEYIKYAKENPGNIRHSASGAAATDKMVATAFGKKAGIQVTHIPYKGYGPAAIALLSGEVESTGVPIGNVIEHVRSGDLRMLALSSGKRVTAAPDVPTFIEQGVDLQWVAWNGFLGPKGMPEDVLETLRDAFKKVFAKEEWQTLLKNRILEPFVLEGQELKDYVDKLDVEIKRQIEGAGLMVN